MWNALLPLYRPNLSIDALPGGFLGSPTTCSHFRRKMRCKADVSDERLVDLPINEVLDSGDNMVDGG